MAAAATESSYNCICGEKWTKISQNQYARNGWGSMNNFLLSYGLRPTPDGYEQGRMILAQFIDGDRQEFIQNHQKCKQNIANNNNQNMMTIRLSSLIPENDEMDRPCSVKVDRNSKVEKVAAFISRHYRYPFRNIQISKYRNDEQIILKNNQTLKQQGIKNNENLFWLSVSSFF